MNEIWLAGVSGIVLVTLLALQVALNIHLALGSKEHRSGGPLAAAWAVCFFIYMTYALLPIRLRHACIAGFVFSVAHLIGAFALYSSHYPAMMEHVSAITHHHKSRFRVHVRFAKSLSHVLSPLYISFITLDVSTKIRHQIRQLFRSGLYTEVPHGCLKNSKAST